jgi:hypothetical protein
MAARRVRCDGHDREASQRAPAQRRDDSARLQSAGAVGSSHSYDFMGHYVDDLPQVLDVDSIRNAGVRIGADPMGGASVDYWERISESHRLDLTVVNPRVDPRWAFMTLDHDGKIRMDCSSPWAMASLIEQRDKFAVATGNDADADRHGIVTPDGGLLNPNHFLAVAIGYLFAHRPGWSPQAGRRQDAGLLGDDRSRGRRAGPTAARGPGRVQVVRRWTARTARWASAARRAPVRRSCAATAACGPPTRTASSSRCWPRRSWP